MKVELKEITVRELAEDYEDNDQGGVVGYGGKLRELYIIPLFCQ